MHASWVSGSGAHCAKQTHVVELAAGDARSLERLRAGDELRCAQERERIDGVADVVEGEDDRATRAQVLDADAVETRVVLLWVRRGFSESGRKETERD